MMTLGDKRDVAGEEDEQDRLEREELLSLVAEMLTSYSSQSGSSAISHGPRNLFLFV